MSPLSPSWRTFLLIWLNTYSDSGAILRHYKAYILTKTSVGHYRGLTQYFWKYHTKAICKWQKYMILKAVHAVQILCYSLYKLTKPSPPP